MKLIFLDVDGVLNSQNYVVSEHDRLGHDNYIKEYLSQGGIPFDPHCINNLKNVLEVTGALICVSSTWRLCEDQRKRLNEALGEYCYRIIGYTKHLSTIRGIEIDNFLNDLKQIKSPLEKYIIIDDDNDMLEEQQPYLIKTNFETGFTFEDARMAINILNSNK